MNLSQLYYFRKLAEVQHFTRAAQELYITQPSLSSSIMSLEKDMGIILFMREGRSVKLTKYGRDFYSHVCAALEELEKGIDNARENSGTIGGRIDVACIPTLCGDFLPRSINSYMQECNPTVKFNVFNGMTPAIIEGIKSDMYDVGFCSMSEGETNLCFVPILSQELIAIVNRDHPLASMQGRVMTLEDFKTHEILTYPENSPVGKIIKKQLKDHNLRATHYGYDETTIGGYTAINQVVAIVADTPLLRQFDNLVHFKLDIQADARLVYMVYHKRNYLTPAVRNYIRHIRQNGLSSDVSGVSEHGEGEGVQGQGNGSLQGAEQEHGEGGVSHQLT